MEGQKQQWGLSVSPTMAQQSRFQGAWRPFPCPSARGRCPAPSPIAASFHLKTPEPSQLGLLCSFLASQVLGWTAPQAAGGGGQSSSTSSTTQLGQNSVAAHPMEGQPSLSDKAPGTRRESKQAPRSDSEQLPSPARPCGVAAGWLADQPEGPQAGGADPAARPGLSWSIFSPAGGWQQARLHFLERRAAGGRGPRPRGRPGKWGSSRHLPCGPRIGGGGWASGREGLQGRPP